MMPIFWLGMKILWLCTFINFVNLSPIRSTFPILQKSYNHTWLFEAIGSGKKGPGFFRRFDIEEEIHVLR